jgi:hypothetical protein
MNTAIDDWEIKLSALVARALEAFSILAQDRVELFAVDCHPWNGIIVLAFLTASEAEQNPQLREPAEMAAWKYYDFPSVLPNWQPPSDLGSTMRNAYENAGGDRAAVADTFFRACAAAVGTSAVQEALAKYPRSDTFRISICHPDTGREYYGG